MNVSIAGPFTNRNGTIDGIDHGSTFTVATVTTAQTFTPEAKKAIGDLLAAAPELLGALRRLSFAAFCRDNVMGDPCRLLQVQAELREARTAADTIIAKATGDTK